MDTEIRTLTRAANLGDTYAATKLDALKKRAGLDPLVLRDGEPTMRRGWSTPASAEHSAHREEEARNALVPGAFAMKTSPCGPCLTMGRVVSRTKKTLLVEDSRGRDLKVKRFRHGVLHASCDRCSGGAQYPMGYMD